MNSRTFFLLSLSLFCAVLIIIPFWAQYFRVTGVDGRVIEWLQVLAGFSALGIGGVTLYFVTIQLAKANEQLVKADVQISLAHKQLELADAQLDLARKDSVTLTLQLRASACAAIEADYAIMDDASPFISNSKFDTLIEMYERLEANPDGFHSRHVVSKIKPTLDDELDSIRRRFKDNLQLTTGYLPLNARKMRWKLDSDFCALRDSFIADDLLGLAKARKAIANDINEYTALLKPIDEHYRKLLDRAQADCGI